MPLLVVTGATLTCTFGSAPAVFAAVPPTPTSALTPAGHINHKAPMVNIPPFVMCCSPNNPAVIAALGAPVPCAPIPTMPWAPGAIKVKLSNISAHSQTSKTMCSWAGMIAVSNAGQTKVNVT